MLTTLSGVTFKVSFSVAKFDRFEDLGPLWRPWNPLRFWRFRSLWLKASRPKLTAKSR